MNIFNLRKRFFIFLIILFLGMLVLQILHKKTKEDPLTKSSYFLFSETQTISVNFHKAVSNIVKKYFFLLNLHEKNKELQKKNKELETRLQLFEENLKENERLKELVRFPLNKELVLLPAQVVGTDFLSKNELLTINKGSSQGVKKFMGVLHPKGVVGYVFRVNPHSSQVISLLSPFSSLPARNRRSRMTGLIEAYKNNLLLFNYLDKEDSKDKNAENLKIGDKIITVKSDQFPFGFLVGAIFSLEYPLKNLNPIVYVKPAVPFYSLEEVLVVLNSKNSFFQKQNPKRVQEESLQSKHKEKHDEDKN